VCILQLEPTNGEDSTIRGRWKSRRARKLNAKQPNGRSSGDEQEEELSDEEWGSSCVENVSACPAVPDATPPRLFHSIRTTPPPPPSRTPSSLADSTVPVARPLPATSDGQSAGGDSTDIAHKGGQSASVAQPLSSNAPPPPPRRAPTSKPLPAIPVVSTRLVCWDIAKSEERFEHVYLRTCKVWM